MNQLQVINRNGKLTIDSREVAEMIGKRHDHLLRDIDAYVEVIKKTTAPNFGVSDFFVESTYKDATGRTLKCYEVTRKGCNMVANKMTGEKGILFTAEYVTRFDEMEHRLQSGVPMLSPNEAMAIALQQTAEMMTKVPVLESRIGNLENTMTIDYGQQRSLRKLGNEIVMKLVGGKNSVAYKKFASKAFNELWKHYKNTFNIESYCNTPALEYERGKEVLKEWKPSEELRYAILGANTEQLVSN